MLSTSNLSAAQAENYFVKDDYYTEEEQHEASFWLGKGAENLGLTGTVEKGVFVELLGGTGPNGEVLAGKEIDPKTRRAATSESAFAAVGAAKQRQVARAASEWWQRHRREGYSLRFDVVAVLVDGENVVTGIEHIEAAFESPLS